MHVFSLAALLAQEEVTQSDLEAWLEFVSATLWQVLAVVFVLLFRRQFAELLGRLSRFKLGSLEGELEQPADPEAPAPVEEPPAVADVPAEPAAGEAPPVLVTGERGMGKTALAAGLAEAVKRKLAASAPVADVIDMVAPGGFLTEKGLDHLLATSGMMHPDEEIEEHLLLLRTKKQRTWLVSTDRSLFCLLDDEKTRARGRVIQWKQPLRAVEDTFVRAKSRNENTGLVDVGNRRNWLYSHSLHADPEQLKRRIEKLAHSA
jgi:hypothetical protein